MDELEDATESDSLLTRVSILRLAPRLQGSASERLPAVRRLASIGSPQALRILTDWLERTPTLGAEERFEVVRAIAPHAAVEGLRPWLFRTLTGPLSADQPGARAYLEMSAQTAALALAAYGKDEGVSLLAKALRRASRAAEFARQALVSYPPRDLAALLAGSGSPSVALLSTLDSLKDPRAKGSLRSFVRQGTPAVQATAALALLHLGDLETVTLAHYWQDQRVSQPELQQACAEILLERDAAAAGPAFSRLLKTQPQAAVRLAARLPAVSIEAPLVAAFATLAPELSAQGLHALGASGSRLALEFLSRQLTSEAHAVNAALALARSPNTAASEVLFDAATQPKKSALAVEALVVRQYLGHAVSSSLLTTLVRWSGSAHTTERRIGIWGRAVLDPAYANPQIETAHADDLVAVAQAAFSQNEDFFARAAHRLAAHAEDAVLARSLAFSVARPAGAAKLPTSLLIRWAQSRAPIAIAAASQLTARPGIEPELVRSLLQSTDLGVRAAAYLGLANNPDKKTAGELARGYYRQSVPEVRLAIIRALSQRARSSSLERVLNDAATLDPDLRVRDAARLAQRGSGVIVTPFGHAATWLSIAPGARCHTALLLQDGVEAVPVALGNVPDMPILGLNSDPFVVRLALNEQLMNSPLCRPLAGEEGKVSAPHPRPKATSN
jgi:hypothetical protein